MLRVQVLVSSGTVGHHEANLSTVDHLRKAVAFLRGKQFAKTTHDSMVKHGPNDSMVQHGGEGWLIVDKDK